jgi:iron complex outermembrane recepter protein
MRVAGVVFGLRESRMKSSRFWAALLSATALSGLGGGVAVAQTAAPAPKPAPEKPTVQTEETVVVTGSRVRRQALDSATPVQVITIEQIKRDGISSPEQLLESLSVNGNGVANLASQSDVNLNPNDRNNNGFSGANLRSQGVNNTLVLLNGRRVASHGLNGAAVDVNQIPLGAVRRVEVMADGASAIYGTDAIGGVINYILREDFEGLRVSAFSDVTAEGGGNIYTVGGTAGHGNLQEDGYNLMLAVNFRKNEYLKSSQRDWINGNQPNRGLAIDTRGTPYGTLFPAAGTLLPSTGTFPITIPGTTLAATGGVNPLALAGGGGCDSIADMDPYESRIWSADGALACSYDTARALTLQQPQETWTFLGRATFDAGEHKLAFEYAGSQAQSARRFSEVQLFPAATGVNAFNYPRNALTQATYDRIFDQVRAASAAPGSTTLRITESMRGLPLAYRWRCMECGQREIDTQTDTGRFLASLEGPIFIPGWEYSLGLGRSFSESTSTTAGGYYYNNTDTAAGVSGLREALRTGIINPFLLPGQTQSQAALDLIKSTEALGVQIAYGKSVTDFVDFSINGPLFELPGGTAQLAVGMDMRKESYGFVGDSRAANLRPVIIGAPIDVKPALSDVDREVVAYFAEALLPVFKGFELGLAVRHDSYTGFGNTTNPKVTVKYRPVKQLAFRGSYSTAFRVPTFPQLFDPISFSQEFAPFADPRICPGGIPTPTIAGCNDLSSRADPNAPLLQSIGGGKPTLEPETADLSSFGFVIEPLANLTASVDWWRIEREGTIRGIDRATLANNFSLFAENFIRDASGRIIFIDQRRVNSGGSLTEGVEAAIRGNIDLGPGKLNAGIDASWITKARDKALAGQPYGRSLIGEYTTFSELFLRYKHTAFLTYATENWTASLSQRFLAGYNDQVYPGVASGRFNPPNDEARTDNYIVYNASIGYTGLKNLDIRLGVRNLLNTEPPFALSYDSGGGSGANWEPRVADPRGRSFTLTLDYDF